MISQHINLDYGIEFTIETKKEGLLLIQEDGLDFYISLWARPLRNWIKLTPEGIFKKDHIILMT